MYVRITPEQITELEGLVNKAWPNTAKAEEFNKMAEVGKRIAMGAKYPDIELTNKEGKKVKLSEYVPEGKYVMLEFWASWCGPCRAEIPHLREVYKEYKDKGFEIVSISIDRKDEDWKKAMKEENMVWTQLNDPGAVSYTHLDVYKRQVYRDVCTKSKNGTPHVDHPSRGRVPGGACRRFRGLVEFGV